jgi:serine/threonine protein kinase
MGVVYRAWQLELDRPVALKVIAPEALEDDAARARFVSEARHAAAIEHPNVVPIYAAGEAGGMAYFVMRFVEGDDLRTRVRRGGPLAPAAAATVLGSAAAALDAIHHAGLVHRDVKPANILLGAGDHVYLTDFGLAREALARGSSASGSGRWAGSLHYAAPEQIRGGRVDARADIYALGGVLVFMLTGQVPFDRDSDEATLWAHVADPPPRPAEMRHGLPKAIDEVVSRAMAKSPDDRYASAGDLGRAALAAAEGRRAPRRRGTVAQGAASPTGALPVPGLSDEAPTLTGDAVAFEQPPRGGSWWPCRRSWRCWRWRRSRGRSVPRGPGTTQRRTATAVAQRSATATSTATPTPAGPQVARRFRSVSHRPNAVLRVGRDLWVTSASRPLSRLDAMTGRGRTLDTRLVPGSAALSRGGSVVWIENRTQREVVAVATAPPHRLLGSLPQTEVPVDVAAEPGGGVWVAVRGHNHGPGAVLHYDAGGRFAPALRRSRRRPLARTRPDGVVGHRSRLRRAAADRPADRAEARRAPHRPGQLAHLRRRVRVGEHLQQQRDRASLSASRS